MMSTKGAVSNSGNIQNPTTTYKSVISNLQWEQLVAGISGGVAATLILHPLDLVKVRFQVNESSGRAPLSTSGSSAINRPQYTGLVNAFTSIYRTQGVRGLYQGVTPNVWGAGASWGLYFLWYNALKVRSRNGDSTAQLHAGQHMLCAAEAGFITLLFTNPLWVAKVRLCLQYDQKVTRYSGMWDCLVKTYQGEGFRGLYKGFLPGAFGVSHGALQFMAYESLKIHYNNYRETPVNSKLGALEYLTFAALSKMFAASATYPYQVVRARLQDQHRQYKGVTDVIRQIHRNEGLRGYYKGMVPGVLRVTPACCVTFVVYEKTIELLLNRKHSNGNTDNQK